MPQAVIKQDKPKFEWDVTDPSFFQMWLEQKTTASDSTVEAYVKAIRNFLQYDPNVESLDDYNKFLIDTAVKKRAYHYYTALKRYVQFKITDATIKQRILTGMIKPKPQAPLHDRKYIPEDKLIKLMNHFKYPKHRIVALIQMMTGVRAGDVLNLKHGQVFMEEYMGRETLRLNIIGKRRKRNVVYIHDKIAQKVVVNYVNTPRDTFEDYLFLDPRREDSQRKVDLNKPLSHLKWLNYKWYFEDLKVALNQVGIDYHDFASHDFRRCFARRAWEKWKDIQILQKLLNHTNPKDTMRYLEQSGLQNIDYHYEMQK
jgi:site-specific recombinase XerD